MVNKKWHSIAPHYFVVYLFDYLITYFKVFSSYDFNKI